MLFCIIDCGTLFEFTLESFSPAEQDKCRTNQNSHYATDLVSVRGLIVALSGGEVPHVGDGDVDVDGGGLGAGLAGVDGADVAVSLYEAGLV